MSNKKDRITFKTAINKHTRLKRKESASFVEIMTCREGKKKKNLIKDPSSLKRLLQCETRQV